MATLLEQEIRSQPEVLTTLLDLETEHVRQIVKELPEFQYALIAARGTSDHAATYAKYAWAALAGYPVALAAPSLYTMYGQEVRMRGALVVGVSQSGESPDILAVLREGHRQGCPTLAITNNGSSPLASEADHVIELHAGEERSVAATKTYTSQLAVMALLAANLGGDYARIDELLKIPEKVAATLERSEQVQARAERYRYAEQCIVIGRGFNYATSFELALKLKELTYVNAIAYSSADFRHGPIATVEEGTPVVLVMPSGLVYDDMASLATELRERRAELIAVSDRAEAHALARTSLTLEPGVPEWLSPITSILPGQMLAWRLAEAKGFDPDHPRGLHKVTLTT